MWYTIYMNYCKCTCCEQINQWSNIKNIYFAWLKVTFLLDYDIFMMFLQLLTERGTCGVQQHEEGLFQNLCSIQNEKVVP